MGNNFYAIIVAANSDAMQFSSSGGSRAITLNKKKTSSEKQKSYL